MLPVAMTVTMVEASTFLLWPSTRIDTVSCVSIWHRKALCRVCSQLSMQMIEAWKETIGPNVPVKIQEIINKGVMAPDLHAALMAVADAPGRQVVSTDRLGRWLRKVDGRIVSGRAIRQAGVEHGYPRWSLV